MATNIAAWVNIDKTRSCNSTLQMTSWKKARTIKGDMKRKMIALRSKMQLAKLDFDEELQKEKPSDAKLKKLIDNIANLGAEKARIHLETKMKITGILTYDQKKELAKKRFSSPMGGRGKHQGRGGKGRPAKKVTTGKRLPPRDNY